MADKELKFIISAKDEASKTLNKVDNSVSRLGKDTDKARKSQEQFKKGLKGVGIAATVVTAAIAATVLIVKNLINEYSVLEDANAQVTASYLSTKGAVGLTLDELDKLATQLTRTSKFSMEAVKSGEAILMTYTSIGEDAFPLAMQAAADMSTKLGTDLKSSISMIGKAINDPVVGLAKLAEAGVVFTDEQKDMVRQLAESGDTLGAQKIMLDELGVEFGGAATESVKTFSGAIDQLSKSMKKKRVDIGKDFADGIKPHIIALTEMLDNIKMEGIMKDAGGTTKLFKKLADAVFVVSYAFVTLKGIFLAGGAAIGGMLQAAFLGPLLLVTKQIEAVAVALAVMTGNKDILKIAADFEKLNDTVEDKLKNTFTKTSEIIKKTEGELSDIYWAKVKYGIAVEDNIDKDEKDAKGKEKIIKANEKQRKEQERLNAAKKEALRISEQAAKKEQEFADLIAEMTIAGYNATDNALAKSLGFKKSKIEEWYNTEKAFIDANIADAEANLEAHKALEKKKSDMLTASKDLEKATQEKAVEAGYALINMKDALISSWYEKEKKLIEDSGKSEEEKAAAMEKLEDEAEKKRKDWAVLNKTMAIGQVAISTATSIMKFMESGYAGIPGAVAAGILGAAQLVTILATPAYAQGGLVTGSGTGTSDSINARLSAGEFVMNAKSTAENLPMLESINRGGSAGGQTINVEIYQPQIINTPEFIEADLIPLINEGVRKGVQVLASEVA